MAKDQDQVKQALSDIKNSRNIKGAVTMLKKSIAERDKKIRNLLIETDLHVKFIEFLKAEQREVLRDIVGKNFEAFIKGYKFERFVVQWMSLNYNEFELKIWQGDKSVETDDGDKIKASWNMYPDLIYVNEEKKQVCALECKYRYNGELKLSKEKIECYKGFENQLKKWMPVDVKVYIMLGCRGTADKPSSMYRIPISIIAKNHNEEDMCIVNAKDYAAYKVNLRAKTKQYRPYDLPF